MAGCERFMYNRDVMHKKQALLAAMDGGQRSVCGIIKISF